MLTLNKVTSQCLSHKQFAAGVKAKFPKSTEKKESKKKESKKPIENDGRTGDSSDTILGSSGAARVGRTRKAMQTISQEARHTATRLMHGSVVHLQRLRLSSGVAEARMTLFMSREFIWRAFMSPTSGLANRL